MLVTSIFASLPKANPLCKFSCDHYTNISLLQLLWLSPIFFSFPLKFLLDVWDATEFSYIEFFSYQLTQSRLIKCIHAANKERKLSSAAGTYVEKRCIGETALWTLKKLHHTYSCWEERVLSASLHTHTPGKGNGRVANSSACLEAWSLYLFLWASTATISMGTFFALFFVRQDMLFIAILANFWENARWEICKAEGNRVFLMSDYKYFWPVHLSTEWHLFEKIWRK